MKIKSTISINSSILDFFRIFASFWVVIAHISYITNRQRNFISEGNQAVEIFIFISGFLLGMIIIKAFSEKTHFSKSDIFRFYVRRYFWIAPLFYLGLIFYYFLREFYSQNIIVTEHFFHAQNIVSRYIVSVNVINFIKNLFIHGIFHGEGSAISGPAWSLSLEIQFYILAPFLILGFLKNNYLYIYLAFCVNFTASKLIG